MESKSKSAPSGSQFTTQTTEISRQWLASLHTYTEAIDNNFYQAQNWFRNQTPFCTSSLQRLGKINNVSLSECSLHATDSLKREQDGKSPIVELSVPIFQGKTNHFLASDWTCTDQFICNYDSLECSVQKLITIKSFLNTQVDRVESVYMYMYMIVQPCTCRWIKYSTCTYKVHKKDKVN